ncbi:60S ribosomal protein L35 [Iris pallida]|uniref:60S ribosomal protein L35 n=1 Tax=Iris pallida TaxID=29817 RepID=A0AAX6E5L6_IRIPA|nr:60S ribosomal protein L35 [Iris pallida]
MRSKRKSIGQESTL